MRHILLGVVLVFVSAISALIVAFPDNARGYHQYLVERRPDLQLAYSEVSEEWTETELRARFPQLQLQCHDSRPGEYPDERGCFADIGTHNGLHALGVAFYFASGKLNHMGISVPWWAHPRQAQELVRTYGKPHAAQPTPIAGVRLVGWQLPGGAAVFFNREVLPNPLPWNLLWASKRSCEASGCIWGSVELNL